MSALAHSADWPLGVPFAVCVVLSALYGMGGRGRSYPRLRGAAFYGGIATIVIALDTPIDAYADKLFWMHMVQHVLLLTIAPPLLVLGRAWPRLWYPLPVAVRRGGARMFVWGAPLAHPAVALALVSATVGIWHLPALYNATLHNEFVHQFEHLTFVVTAIMFWAPVVGAPPLRDRLSDPARCLYLILAMVPMWILAVVLAFAPKPLYAYDTLAHRPGGISALADQQIAAGVMWVPGSVVYVVAACIALYVWLDPSGEHRQTHSALLI